MKKPSFRVYIDESGEEGFVFKPDNAGSSRWLILSAVITRMESDRVVVDLMKRVRVMLGRSPKQALHFCKMDHQQRVPYVRQIAETKLHTVSVLIHKPSIAEPEKFQAEKHLLYRYACRMLLERVSWLCREHRVHGKGDGTAEIIFSNRAQMSYDDLRDYIQSLKDESDPLEVTIDWTVIKPRELRAVEHSQLAGLQVADAVASSLFAAVNVNRYGETEDRYIRILAPVAYRHKGALLGYGLKFWPETFEGLKMQNPHLAGLAELLLK